MKSSKNEIPPKDPESGPIIASSTKHAAALLSTTAPIIRRFKLIIPSAFTGSGRIDVEAVRAAMKARPEITLLADRESKESAEVRNIQATYRRREFELAVRKKEFTKTSEVILLHTRLTLACRARLLAVGPSLAQRLAITQDPAECERLITEKQIEALAELCKCEWAKEPVKKSRKKAKKKK